MISVKVNGGDVDKAITQFKRNMNKSGIPSKLREKQSYEKKGVKNRRKKEENIANCRSRNRKNRDRD